MRSSGNEIGPFRAVEESILSQLTEKDDRTDVFAWYTMCGTAGAAIGTITSGWLVQALSEGAASNEPKTYRIIFMLYAALGVVKLLLVLSLSPNVELQYEDINYQEVIELDDEEESSSHSSSPRGSAEGTRPSTISNAQQPPMKKKIISLLPQVSSKSLLILLRLAILFALDSFASGLASPSWLTYFFTTFHSVAPGTLGTLFFTTNILATLSNFAALPLARRLGPLKTMTYTHLTSAILLGLISFPGPSGAGTVFSMALLAMRACTQSMDQAPRQAFLAAVMRPEERTAVLGIVNIVKTLAQAGGIGTAGTLAAQRAWRGMFGSAGLMKVAYDLLILWAFLRVSDKA